MVSLAYRGAPPDGAEDALIGTAEHGVPGRRWIYDGCHDPVPVAELAALFEGEAQAQAQSLTDTPDPEVSHAYAGQGPVPAEFGAVTDTEEHAELSVPGGGTTLRVLRRPRPAPAEPGAVGHVAGAWDGPDGTRVQGVFFVLRSTAGA